VTKATCHFQPADRAEECRMMGNDLHGFGEPVLAGQLAKLRRINQESSRVSQPACWGSRPLMRAMMHLLGEQPKKVANGAPLSPNATLSSRITLEEA
jgi:hypothetical protein